MTRPITRRALNRRTFLRGAGVCLGLPLLEAMSPALAASTPVAPRRMVAIQPNMGMMPRYFFPEGEGADWKPSRYLAKVAHLRDRLTVISGSSHPGVDGGHEAENCFLTAAPHPGRNGFRNSISVDQVAAEHIGVHTRYPSLVLSIKNAKSLSYTAAGVMIPPIRTAAELFEQLFIEGTEEEVERQIDQLRRGRSVLDFVLDDARHRQRTLGHEDRQRMEQYFSSVRDLEQRLQANEAWQHKPKPEVDAEPPESTGNRDELVRNTRAMFEVMRLALATDSTRLITLFIDTAYVTPTLPGVENPVHPLTHHGGREDRIAELATVEDAQTAELAAFLDSLHDTPEDRGSLLDNTMVLYGNCMGNANSHTNHNLPVLLAGGGFKHGRHLVFDQRPGHNYPLPNLYLSMLQQLGVEADRFASSTGTMRGMEPVG